MYKKQASLEEMLVFCNTQEVAYHSACASELHVVGQSQVLDEDAIESIFETCFDDSLSVIIQKGCLLSVTTSITDYIFAQSTDILPVTTMFAQSEEMQYIYINATYGTYAKTIQHVSDVSLVDFCNAFTQKAIIDYCLNKSRD
jgi:hypothetical protein